MPRIQLRAAERHEGSVRLVEIPDTGNSKRWADALETLRYIDQHGFLYVERNFRVFQAALAQNPKSGGHEWIVEVAGSVMDWLGAARVFLAHSERRLTGTAWLDDFKSACSAEYDGFFSYRFLYRLRNYAQHLALPVHTLALRSTGRHLLLDRDALIEQYDGWSSVKDELAEGPAEIDIAPMIAEMMGSLRRIAQVARRWDDEVGKDAVASYREMRSYFHTNFPGMVPATYTTDDDGPLHLGSVCEIQALLSWERLDELAQSVSGSASS